MDISDEVLATSIVFRSELLVSVIKLVTSEADDRNEVLIEILVPPVVVVLGDNVFVQVTNKL